MQNFPIFFLKKRKEEKKRKKSEKKKISFLRNIFLLIRRVCGRNVMLKGIPRIICPNLLHSLGQMNHGDLCVIADANFPAASVAAAGSAKVIYAPGTNAEEMLDAVLTLTPLDTFEAPLYVMQVVGEPDKDLPIYSSFSKLASRHESDPKLSSLVKVERFAFYEMAKRAFCIVQTGEQRLYGNIIVKKGVIPPPK